MRASENGAVIRMELKYCEACGGLWFRREESEEIYCQRCVERMGAIAVGKAVARA
jgi:Zn-finger nucleic acid-binding protein